MTDKIVGKEYLRPRLERGDLFSHGKDGDEYVVTSNTGEKSPVMGAAFICRCRETTGRMDYKHTRGDSMVYYRGSVNLDDQDNIVEKKGKKMKKAKKAKITPVQKAAMDLIIAEVKKRTAEVRGGAKKAPDTREQKISDLIGKEDFGCKRESVMELVGMIIGKELPPARTTDKGKSLFFSKVGIAIVPTSRSTNGHTYEVEKSCITHSMGTAVCLKSDGTVGNNITTKPEELRAATDEDIDEFFKDYPMDRLHQVFEHDTNV